MSKCNGDLKKAKQMAIAQCRGGYQNKDDSISLLNGQEKQVTMSMKSLKMMSVGSAWFSLRRHFPSQITDYIKSKYQLQLTCVGMQQRSDQKGVAFDIPQDKYQKMMDIFKEQKQRSTLNFTLEACLQKPDLIESYEDESSNHNNNYHHNSHSNANENNYGGNK